MLTLKLHQPQHYQFANYYAYAESSTCLLIVKFALLLLIEK